MNSRDLGWGHKLKILFKMKKLIQRTNVLGRGIWIVKYLTISEKYPPGVLVRL